MSTGATLSGFILGNDTPKEISSLCFCY